MEQRLSSAFRAVLAGAIVLGTVGCGSSPSHSSSGGGGLEAGGASYIYAINENQTTGVSAVEQFTAGSNGSVAPISTLNVPSGFEAQSVVVDSTGQIYVSGANIVGIYQVLAYAAGSTGSATPTRTITLNSSIGDNEPYSLSVDSSNNLYVVGIYGSITEYSTTANGTATPTRTITGTLTTLPSLICLGVAFDGAGNLYVSTGNEVGVGGYILEFAAGANGNVAPIRTISTGTDVFLGIAVDASGDVFASEDNTSGTAAAAIVEFSPTASGPAAPSKTIVLTGSTPSFIYGLRMDSAGNLFASLDTDANGADSYSIVGVGPSANGSVSPAKQFSSTSLSGPTGQLALQ